LKILETERLYLRKLTPRRSRWIRYWFPLF